MANSGGVAWTPVDGVAPKVPQLRLKRVNNYVAGMQYNSDVDGDSVCRVALGQPAASDVDGVVASVAMTNGSGHTATLLSTEADAPYGRCLIIDADGANTRVLTAKGYDYLGQPMTENITFNGTTAVLGKKAFFSLTSITIATGTDTTAITVGWADKFGLPFHATALVRESVDGVVTGDGGALVNGSSSTPTATTADPRGAYTPHANNAPDGSKDFVVSVVCSAIMSTGTGTFGRTKQTGGLHGLPHYNA